ncbi:hypothetical protein AAMO2058_000715300 [Amorphochlora amoebiformis]
MLALLVVVAITATLTTSSCETRPTGTHKTAARKGSTLPSLAVLRRSLKRAVSEGQIRKVGRIVKRRPDGTVPHLIGIPKRDQLQDPEWSRIVTSAIGGVRERLGEGLVSVALRGSLAAGRAVVGTSDVDLLIVYNPSQSPPKTPKILQKLAHNLSSEARPIATKVELTPIPMEGYPMGGYPKKGRYPKEGGYPKGGGLEGEMGFRLKVGSRSVWGEQFEETLPEGSGVPPKVIISELTAAVERALRYAMYPDPNSPIDSNRALRWALKRCLRSAMEVRFPQTYTRDLLACAWGAGRGAEDRRRRELTQALLLATSPSPLEVAPTISLVKSLLSWIVDLDRAANTDDCHE